MKVKIIASIFLFQLLFQNQILGNETLPTSHWAYKFIDELRVNGYFSDLWMMNKPFTRHQIAWCLRSIQQKIRDAQIPPQKHEQWLLDQLTDEFQWEMENLNSGTNSYIRYGVYGDVHSERQKDDSEVIYSLKSIFNVSIFKNLSFFNSMKFDKGLLDDLDYFGEQWRGMAAFTEQAYARYSYKNLDFIFGRDFIKWGSGKTGNLIISDHSRPLDQLAFSITYKFLKFNYLGARLDSWLLSDSLAAQNYAKRAKRYLSAHRIDINIKNKLHLGLTEALLYGSTEEGLEIQYHNPFLYYHGELLNMGGADGNGFLGLDVDFFPRKNLEIYSELMIDDIQIERTVPDDLEPTEYGIILGLQTSDLLHLRGSLLNLEYVHISNRTYNSKVEWEKFLHRNQSLAYYLGNDCDQWRFFLQQWLKKGFQLSAGFMYIRKGEGSIKSEWDTPWMEYTLEQGYSEPFPTGIIEKTLTSWIGLTYHFCPYFFVDTVLEYNRIENDEHNSGMEKNGWSFNIKMWYGLTQLYIDRN